MQTMNILQRSALILMILGSLTLSAGAQQSFRRFAIGVGGGLADSYTDRSRSDGGYIALGTLDYFFTPYLNAGLELQGGTISGFSENAQNGQKQGFDGEFVTLQARGKVHAGEFAAHPRRYKLVYDSFVSRVLKGLYLGTGGGVIIIRSRADSEASYHNKELYLPAMAGLDVYLGQDSRLLLNLNYQMNFVLGDKIDGVAMPGSNNDMFSSITIGFAYTFGKLLYL